MNQQIITFFIGGAGDASRYFGAGPHFLMRDQVKAPFDKVAPTTCLSIYLGYGAVYGKKNIQQNILSCIANKQQTLINIVGYSLGGWNGAHLAEILTAQGYTVDVLITLDPVGTNAGVAIVSKIYWNYPIPQANHWINVLTKPPLLEPDDVIARAGGQWIPPQNNVHAFYETLYHHREVGKLFTAPLGEGLSAVERLLLFIQRAQKDVPLV